MTYKWTAGRYVRTVLGSVLFLGGLGFIGLEFRALLTVPGFRIEWEHVVLHGMVLVAAWGLIHKDSLLEVLAALPIVGRAVGRMRGPTR